jgi:hypothetical protein
MKVNSTIQNICPIPPHGQLLKMMSTDVWPVVSHTVFYTALSRIASISSPSCTFTAIRITGNPDYRQAGKKLLTDKGVHSWRMLTN